MDYIIIVAGGKGLRMGSDIPKQFLPVKGIPVLMRTITRFYEYNPQINIILVLPRQQQQYWRELCQQYNFNIAHTVVDGGDTRFASSRNGIAIISDSEQGVVGIHDGVRPFVSTSVIAHCYEKARNTGAVIPVLPVTDTLRYIIPASEGHNVMRENYRIVQTPQVFDIALIKRAFAQPFRNEFTDDASVVEAMGNKVEMVDGNPENIKLTTPFDLKIAEILC